MIAERRGFKTEIVTVSQDVMSGTPVLDGTRVPVQALIEACGCPTYVYLSLIVPEQPMGTLQKIQQRIVGRDYFISSHSEEEMVDDGLERRDMENAILKGRIEKKLTHCARGTRYRIEGPALDRRSIHVVCRFGATGNLIIITVYAS